MTIQRKTSKILTMLLILLMGMVCILPSGQHLELCFGSDGHVDVSVDSCADQPMSSQQQLAADRQAHHEACRDISFACKSSAQLLNPTERTSLKKSSSAAAGFLAASPLSSQAAGAAGIPASYQPALPPFHLVFLKAVVLVFYS